MLHCRGRTEVEIKSLVPQEPRRGSVRVFPVFSRRTDRSPRRLNSDTQYGRCGSRTRYSVFVHLWSTKGSEDQSSTPKGRGPSVKGQRVSRESWIFVVGTSEVTPRPPALVPRDMEKSVGRHSFVPCLIGGRWVGWGWESLRDTRPPILGALGPDLLTRDRGVPTGT